MIHNVNDDDDDSVDDNDETTTKTTTYDVCGSLRPKVTMKSFFFISTKNQQRVFERERERMWPNARNQTVAAAAATAHTHTLTNRAEPFSYIGNKSISMYTCFSVSVSVSAQFSRAFNKVFLFKLFKIASHRIRIRSSKCHESMVTERHNQNICLTLFVRRKKKPHKIVQSQYIHYSILSYFFFFPVNGTPSIHAQ